MGLLQSKQNYDMNLEFKQSIEKLVNDKVYEYMDANKDGIVTHNEFSKWKIGYKKSMNKIITKLQKENTQKINKIQENFNQTIEAKDAEIKELKNKLKYINHQNDELENNNSQLLKGITDNDNRNIQSIISKTKIAEYVDEILKNDTLNLERVPDWIEKPIYKNVLLIVLHIIDKISKEATVELFGHKMRIVMQ